MRDAMVPESTILLGPFRNFLYSRGLQLIDALASILFLANEPCVSQHTQMLRDGRPAHPEAGSEIVDRCRSAAEPVENRAPGGIRYGAEYVGDCRFLSHDYR